jgi:hypothetical protein
LKIKNLSKSNLTSVIGYGTFITKGLWKSKQNVAVCLIKDYIRIFPEANWYPYALPLIGASFYALKFDVSGIDLKILDYYEGVPDGIFKRVKIEVLLKENIKIKAFIYIPTDDIIKSYNLSPELDKFDRWKEKIKKIPGIGEKFPELLL